MQWSFGLIRVAGSEVRIHVTFLLLLAWVGFVYYQSGGWPGAVDGIVFIIAIFACVVLHEFGHALVARRFGIVTPRITLLPIGGVAEMEKMPEKPSEEIWVALAGPAVNVAIAAILILVFGITLDPESVAELESTEPPLGIRLLAVNIMLVLFNLIPAFPMDGGRVLRAVLAMYYSRVKATEIAATIGQFAAFGFGFLGLVGGSPILVFIAIFVYLAAASESHGVAMQAVTRSVSVREAMITHYDALQPGDTLADAGDALLRTTQHEFPVIDHDGHLIGMLTRSQLVADMAEHGPAHPVTQSMIETIPVADARGSLESALRQLQQTRAPAVAVRAADGRLAGYITMENITELMLLRQH